VTDAGMKDLAPLKNLTILDLLETKVTDVGLKELSPLENLTALQVKGKGVTSEGLGELRKSMPRLHLISAAPESGDANRDYLAPPPLDLAAGQNKLPLPINIEPREVVFLSQDSVKALLVQDKKNLELLLDMAKRTGRANINTASRGIKSNALMIGYYANNRLSKQNNDPSLAALRDDAIKVAVAAGRKNFNLSDQIKQLDFDKKAVVGVEPKALTTAQLVNAANIDIEELMYQFKKTSVGGLGIEEDIKSNAKKLKMTPAEAILLAERVLAVTELCDNVTPAFDAKKPAGVWRQLNANLHHSAQDLIKSAKNEPKGMAAAFAKLDKACITCHERFK
jgi:hypothetical protein